jgi:hypothetical protein
MIPFFSRASPTVAVFPVHRRRHIHMPQCSCAECLERLPWQWRDAEDGGWAEFYMEVSPYSVARPALGSKATVGQALEAFCSGETPLEWRVALGVQLANARPLLEKGPEVYKQVKTASQVEKMLKVSCATDTTMTVRTQHPSTSRWSLLSHSILVQVVSGVFIAFHRCPSRAGTLGGVQGAHVGV